jgi:hypothetical protein
MTQLGSSSDSIDTSDATTTTTTTTPSNSLLRDLALARQNRVVPTIVRLK